MSFYFTNKTLVWIFIKRFLEVNIYYVDGFSVFVHFVYVIEEIQQTCKAWTFISEPVLCLNDGVFI